MTLTMCIINVIIISLLSRACKNAAKEGNKTVELIHTTYGYNTDIDMPVTFYLFGLTMDNHILSMVCIKLYDIKYRNSNN
ncbi:hypothetical protein PUN28_002170 [Cardiocondyla obscurior]|uniref:Uncharacterized protein n=1 Tax=Cardiocondyla obscurior TaxID=286306 RepID=A0AAW2GSY7_9HYME